jgi:hypothetical protein
MYFMTEVYKQVQETALSTLYIILFIKFLREYSSEREVRITFYLLVTAYIVIIMADVVTITLLYMDWFLPRMMILTFSSSLKLRIELLVLNRLTRFGQHESIAGNNLESGGTDQAMLKATSSPVITPGDQTPSPFSEQSADSMEPILGRKREVSIWNVDGPACPFPMRPSEPSEIIGNEDEIRENNNSIDFLERQYLGPLKEQDMV